MEYYVHVFPNSRIGEITEYPDESLDEHFTGMAGKVLNGQFTLDGVSWQIIPRTMGDLVRRPEQILVMMAQKKIVIAELENA